MTKPNKYQLPYARGFNIIVGSGVEPAVKEAAQDLVLGLQKMLPQASLINILSDKDPIPEEGHLLLIGHRDDHAAMRSLLTDDAPAAPTQWNTFHIFSLPRESSPFDRTIFLEGADLQGRQYACYEFMESTLGIRFLNPDFDFYPIVKGNAMTLTEVPIHSPDFHWRGLQVWHYNYDRRGTDTFCNINKHVVDGNWEWFRRLARWMIANKQNLIQWYDETMCYDPISVHLPKEIIQYIRMRGIHRLLGIGWPANEGMPADWRTDKEHICIKPDGECVDADPQAWMRCPCQATSDYWKLAEKNMAVFNFNDHEFRGHHT